jgi:hypothetical protein
MGFYGQAEAAAQKILRAFEDTNSLPKPLAQVFIRRKGRPHCREWSWRNQLLVALHGYSDARGFRQWQEVGRHVKRGERAFYILAPVTRKLVDEATGEGRVIVVGFRGVPVFGLEQTEGARLPAGDPEAGRWIESLPLLDVAKRWGLAVEAFDGEGAGALGLYRHGTGIALGVKNLSTWAHELLHAADDRLDNLVEQGQHWRSEIVAELGGAVLLRLLGLEEESDLGGCWEYVKRYADEAGVEVAESCGRVLDRLCAAVALALDTAEQLSRQVDAQPAAGGTHAGSA